MTDQTAAQRRIPFLIFGDGPRIPSGLARIARDLTTRLYLEQEELGIHVAQVGIDPGIGWSWHGWDFYGFQETEQDRGRAAVEAALTDLRREVGHEEQPIILMITDPARCFDLTRELPRDVAALDDGRIDAAFWGYFPIDGENLQGAVGGPAAECLRDTDRILAYGKYGAGVINTTLANTPGYVRGTAQPYLPHGIDTHIFQPRSFRETDGAFFDWQSTIVGGTLRIGCVATNQPRKDLGLLFMTVNELKAQGARVALWLQTDVLTKVWDIGELARTCGLTRAEVFVSTEEMTDVQLAARYAWSDVTIAPGLGEGFGYPIVESLACGTPVIHGNYAGGVALIPNPDWLVDPIAWRLESVYALLRPVFAPKDFAAAVLQALRGLREEPTLTAAYCRGSVAHLDWQDLWPRWRAAIRKGLIQHGESRTHEPE